MSEAVRDSTLPKGALLSAIALVLLALVMVTAARLTGLGSTRMILPAVVESRDLRFEDGNDGAVLVFDAHDRNLVDSLAPGTNGFVRVVLRGLARERRMNEIGQQPPFRLSRFQNGQMTLLDTSTNKQIDLAAFGSSNAEAFARLLPVRGGAK